MQQLIAGVDIGGTHITVCLVDIDKKKLLSSTMTRAHIDPALEKEKIIRSWSDAIKESFLKAGIPVGRIGIAMPGPFDYEKGISYIRGLHKYEHLYGENVKELIGTELGISPDNILMMNDASAFLLGELSCGAGIGFHNLVGITLGTGLGSASYFDGGMHEGDLWSMPFKNGRAEDHVCARWLVTAYENITVAKIADVKTIAERFASDRNAAILFMEFGRNLGEVLIKRYCDQSPDLIVIGGNIARAWDCFIPEVQNVFAENGVSFLLKPAELGEEAALIGGSYLWK